MRENVTTSAAACDTVREKVLGFWKLLILSESLNHNPPSSRSTEDMVTSSGEDGYEQEEEEEEEK